jgi:FtsZ-binding cell division protein ZapB
MSIPTAKIDFEKLEHKRQAKRFVPVKMTEEEIRAHNESVMKLAYDSRRRRADLDAMKEQHKIEETAMKEIIEELQGKIDDKVMEWESKSQPRLVLVEEAYDWNDKKDITSKDAAPKKFPLGKKYYRFQNTIYGPFEITDEDRQDTIVPAEDKEVEKRGGKKTTKKAVKPAAKKGKEK